MYVDLLFITELLNDSLIIMIVSHITGYRVRKKRLLASAFFSAIISTLLAYYYSNSSVVFNLIAGIMLCLIMIKIAFNPCDRKTMFHLFIYTYAAAFIIGGIVSFLCARIPTTPTWIFFLISCILLHLGLFLTNIINKSTQKFCSVSLHFPDKICKCTALIDSGNMLVDNETKLPISILEESILSESIDRASSHLISFNSLGCKNGTLEIVYIPHICIEYNGEKKLIEHVPVGIAPDKLSASDSYRMIISPDIMNKWRFKI